MTFLELQDAVLADAFDASKRGDVKNWINHAYAILCDLDEWTWMRASAAVAVTSGSQTVSSMPADFGVANALVDQYGASLEKILDPEVFYDRYTGLGASTGQPEAFVNVNNGLLVGPTSNVSSSAFRLVYERVVTAMSADSDVPILPAMYHMALVHGAKAEGARLTLMPDAPNFDQAFQTSIEAMRNKYLRPIHDRAPQVPAYRPY